MNIIFFGGAFNPVHRGHMYIAGLAAKQYPRYRILFFPSHLSPHKGNEAMIGAQHRINMLKISLAGTDYILDPWETERRGVSYTIKTIKHIYRKYGPEEKPLIMIGDDLVPILHKWKRIDELKELAGFLVFRRDQDSIPSPEIDLDIRYLGNAPLAISSTEIREMIGRGESPEDLLPAGVFDYIRTKGLYGFRSE